MKKRFFSLVSLALMVAMLTACGSKPDPAPAQSPSASQPSQPSQSQSETVKETSWPEKTVQVVVPYNAGGDTDLYARAAAKYLEQELGETFVIINSAGNSGMTAAQDMLTAEPDGYNVFFTHTAKLTQEAVGLTDFSFVNDFESGGNIVMDSTFVTVARADGPYKTLQDVVDASKANPESVRCSQVYGSVAHLVNVQWEDSADIRLKWLDVGSSNGDKIAALLSDQCDLITVNYSTIKDYVENGDFTILGITAESRVKTLPDLPTYIEQGFDVVADKRYSFNFPQGTDPAIIEKMNDALAKVAANPDFAAEVESYLGVVHYTDPKETNDYERAMVAEYKALFDKSTH